MKRIHKDISIHTYIEYICVNKSIRILKNVFKNRHANDLQWNRKRCWRKCERATKTITGVSMSVCVKKCWQCWPERGGGRWKTGRGRAAVSCGRPLLQKKKKEEPKAPRSTKSVVPCAILFIYFSCILFFALCTHIDTLIHTHARAEQANFIFIFIISLRHINKSHGHDGEKLKMILNN